MLVFPAKPANAHSSGSFEHRYGDHLAPHIRGRIVCDGGKRVIRDGFNKAVAKCTQGHSKRADLVVRQDVFLDFGINGAIVDERSSGMLDKLPAVVRPGTNFGDLAAGTHNWI